MSRVLPLAVVLAALSAPAAAGEPIEGVWANPEKSVKVRVGPCGTRFCGTVISAAERAKSDAARHGTQLVGSQLLSGLEPREGHYRGKVFVPDAGIRASAKVMLVSADRLRIQGCAVGGLVCKSQTWARVAP